MTTMTMTTITECPADDTFTRLLDGTLGPEPLAELERHCDGCGRCARTLAELARTITPAGASDPSLWLQQRYRLLEPLGAGGMGVVHIAFDTKLQRKVAIKRLRDAGDDASADRRRGRFLREAQLLASLSHHNVLTVHDIGGTEREIYVVMELIDGWPMSQWIAETQPRPGWRAIVDLYLQAGRGLSAAHQLGVIHRDVKPENILVARSGRGLIGDFGLAGLARAGDGAPHPALAAPLTQTGAVLGTPAYMAPEVHDGGTGNALSDQFSFCVSLHESLHGRRPFSGQTAEQLAAAVRAGGLTTGLDGIPPAVDRVIGRGLRAQPAQRYPSMDALLDDLSRARERRRTPRPLAYGAVTTMALLVATATVGFAWFASDAAKRKTGVAVPIVSTALSPRVPEPAAAPPTEAVAAAPDVARGRPTSEARTPSASRPVLRPVAAPNAQTPMPAETDTLMLLYLADSAAADRDGVACLAALDRVPAGAWPFGQSEQALRRRATCEMLRGNCAKGRRMLEPVDGPYLARGALLENCPANSLASIDDRLQAVAAQADETRYQGNQPARRKELKKILMRQTAAAEIQSCLHNHGTQRGCGRRLRELGRAYQVLAESFLSGGDCRAGALLDLMQSQVRFQMMGPDHGDAALRCHAERIEAYPACAAAGGEAERRCIARVQAAGEADTGVATMFPLPELTHDDDLDLDR